MGIIFHTQPSKLFHFQEYHDYEHSLSRYDFTPNPNHDKDDASYGKVFGNQHLGVIHQFLEESNSGKVTWAASH